MKNLGVVYEIRNKVNNKRYVGSAANGKRRKREHFSSLRRGKHHSGHLQNAFNKYGESAFFFSVIEDGIPLDYLVTREQYWLDKLLPEYNIAKVAGSTLGMKWSDESKAKMKATIAGRVLSDEHRANLRLSKLGSRHSDESRAKMSEARRGKTLSDGHRANLSKSLTGRIVTSETRAKIGAANSGHIHTDEVRARMSASHSGVPLAHEHIANSAIGHFKPIQQLDKDTGEIIRVWAGILPAAQELGLNRRCVSAACNGKRKSSGGYKWAFVDD